LETPEFHLCSPMRPTKCIDDPIKVSLVTADLTNMQNFLLWQLTPTIYFGFFWRKANPIAFMIAMIFGFTTFIGLYTHQKNCGPGFGTMFSKNVFDWAEGKVSLCDVGSYVFDPYGPHLWGGFVNIVISSVLCVVMGEWKPGKPNGMNIGVEQFGANPLSYDEMLELMKGTVEPCKNPVGIGLLALASLLQWFCLPWYHTSYDGCDVVTYQAFRDGADAGDCTGGSFIGGFPSWAFTCVMGWVIGTIFNLFAMITWKTVDKEATTDLFRIDRQASGESAQGGQQSVGDVRKEENVDKI